MSLLDFKIDDHTNWFVEGLCRRVGNDLQTSFRDDFWVGSIPLKVMLSRRYSVFYKIGKLVAKLEILVDGALH